MVAKAYDDGGSGAKRRTRGFTWRYLMEEREAVAVRIHGSGSKQVASRREARGITCAGHDSHHALHLKTSTYVAIKTQGV